MNVKSSPEGTIRGALRYPAFRALLAGLAVSQAGDWLYNIALVTLVYERTAVGDVGGVTTAARIVPMVVLGPFGGVVADRFDRRRVMVGLRLIRLALMLALALVAAANLPVVLAPVIAALATAAASPVPAVGSRDHAAAGRRARTCPARNAARAAVAGAGIIAGPALGGVLLLLGPPALAFLVNAATFGAVRGRCAGHPGRRWPSARAGSRRAAERAAAPTSWTAPRAAGAPGGGAAGRRRRRLQPGLRHADRAAPAASPGRSGLGLHGLRLPVRRAGRRRPGRHRAGRPGAARMPGRAVLVATLAAVGLPCCCWRSCTWRSRR